jgi:hypothetical protein
MSHMQDECYAGVVGLIEADACRAIGQGRERADSTPDVTAEMVAAAHEIRAPRSTRARGSSGTASASSTSPRARRAPRLNGKELDVARQRRRSDEAGFEERSIRGNRHSRRTKRRSVRRRTLASAAAVFALFVALSAGVSTASASYTGVATYPSGQTGSV